MFHVLFYHVFKLLFFHSLFACVEIFLLILSSPCSPSLPHPPILPSPASLHPSIPPSPPSPHPSIPPGVVRVEQKNNTLLEMGFYDDGPYEVGDENRLDPDLVPVPANSYLGRYI